MQSAILKKTDVAKQNKQILFSLTQKLSCEIKLIHKSTANDFN